VKDIGVAFDITYNLGAFLIQGLDRIVASYQDRTYSGLLSQLA